MASAPTGIKTQPTPRLSTLRPRSISIRKAPRATPAPSTALRREIRRKWCASTRGTRHEWQEAAGHARPHPRTRTRVVQREGAGLGRPFGTRGPGQRDGANPPGAGPFGPFQKATVQLSWKIHRASTKRGKEGTGITWQLLTFSLHLLCQCGRKQTTCEGNGAQ